ncbi:DNA mismatch repair endonuclease MutL [bacterium]|nr:DNA mismatch repair endonuclease MutL [bacterium]MBU1985498.1 DNA mismatch repair endonuclease MutL [bacterium]
MPEIRILPENVVNQIAAGEVVERAASVLKELVENALDAGASRIQILVKGQGRNLIQVVDDGCGMSRENLLLAFERHATSKLSRAEDLQAVRTLGFRGEALPAIASVSYVEVRSGLSDAGGGTMVRFEGGRLVHEEPIAAVTGTSIAVHSLFYNTPARARFLKSASTELAHLIRVFRQYALAHPEVAWLFSHDDSVEYNLPSADFASRLNGLFGNDFADKTVPLGYEAGGVVVAGAVGTAELNKKSRGSQYLFLNCRPIQSPLLHSAIRSALREQLEEGEWPFYAISLDMAPSEVDVNVHPAKLEVKLADERRVHDAVYRAIRAALTAHFAEQTLPTEGSRVDSNRSLDRVENRFGNTTPTAINAEQRGWNLPLEAVSPSAARAASLESPVEEGELFRPAIFQVHQKYLISQIRSGIAIIDQHAAHERILFEKALRSLDERTFNSQQLLFPILLELEPESDAVFQEVRDDLTRLGFQIRNFGVRTYSIEAVPAGIRRVSEVDTIRSILDEYVEFRKARFEPRDALAAGFACRAAIRAGDALTSDEMITLMDELFATQFPLTCPHGRPTVIHLKLSELDRRFKRTE